MIVKAKPEAAVPESWMREPFAIQEYVLHLTNPGAHVQFRVEDPGGTVRLVDAFPCEAIDVTLPLDWTGTWTDGRKAIIGPEAWQDADYWTRYSAGEATAVATYVRYRTNCTGADGL